MSSSPLRRHSLAIGGDSTPSRLPQLAAAPTSPSHNSRSVSSSSALPVLSQGRSFSPSTRPAIDAGNIRLGAISAGSPYPARLSKLPSRDHLRDTPPTITSPKEKQITSINNDSHVQVVLRIRPSSISLQSDIPSRFQRVVLKPSSADPKHEVAIQQGSESPRAAGNVINAAGNKAKYTTFRYDKILPEECTQLEAYESSARAAVDKFLTGFNVTILAYGQTSSGKSYTMGTTGADMDYTNDDDPTTGLIPRAVKDMFLQLEQEKRQAGDSMTWECRVSFLELYNEDLIDLLSTSSSHSPPITIREDKGKIIWSGLREVTVSTIQQVMQLLHDGSRRRQIGETGMNKESSRSHAVFSLSLVQRKRSETTARSKNFSRPTSMAGSPYTSSPRGTPTNTRPGSRSSMLPPTSNAIRQFSTPSTPGRGSPDDDPMTSGWVEIASKFHFVDLAGSERLKRTAALGERMKEGISINAGLTALGNVISALAENASKHTHIPYRDSKLTRLLQDSLGGNSYTVMIACVSPIEYNLNETVNTLRYGARARSIKNRAEANQTEVGWDDLVHLQGLVVKLRKEMDSLKSTGPTHAAVSEEAVTQARQRLSEEQHLSDSLRSQIQLQNLEIARLTNQVQTHKQGNTAVFDTEGIPFSQMVEPIIDEYEKTISNLEAEIERYKAALQISESVAEEHAEQIMLKNKRLEAQEAYIHELRTRITKYAQSEREVEARVRELEIQSKSSEEGMESVTEQDLREALRKQQEAMTHNATYLSELESRLETSDDRIENLTRQIAELESASQQDEVASNHASYQAVERRLRAELDAKDERLRELQLSFDKAIRECMLLVDERDKLQDSNETLKIAEKQLERQSNSLSPVSELENGRAIMDDNRGISDTPTQVPESPVPAAGNPAPKSGESEVEMTAMSREHFKTLKELSIVKAQYHDALEKLKVLNSTSKGSDVPKPVSGESKKGAPSPDEGADPTEGETIGRVPKEVEQNNEKVNDSPDVNGRSDFQVGRGQSRPFTTAIEWQQQQSSSSSSLSHGRGTGDVKDLSMSKALSGCNDTLQPDSQSSKSTVNVDTMRLKGMLCDPSRKPNTHLAEARHTDGHVAPANQSSSSPALLPQTAVVNALADVLAHFDHSAADTLLRNNLVDLSSETSLAVNPILPGINADECETGDKPAARRMQRLLEQTQADIQERTGQLKTAEKDLDNSNSNRASDFVGSFAST